VVNPDDYRIWNHYDAVNIPVLCLHGVASDLVLPATIAEMRRRGPGTKGLLSVMDIPDCGHAPALNVPVQLTAVSSFIAGHTR
jgi:pimeloyl-ACP methyl ester carboxylesterase